MDIALFLHIYQPPTQYPYMVRKITSQSYEKIVELLERFPDAKLTLNINASLTEQLGSLGYTNLLERISYLSEEGRIELVASAAYHPILPELPVSEIIRQINLNNSINHSYFGSAYNPKGFFPPELAYEEKLAGVVEKKGFKWMLVDDSAISKDIKYLSEVYRRKGSKLLIFPREDNLSFRIAFGRIKTYIGLVRAIGAKNLSRKKYMILAMDGETFGHHQPKQLRFLRALFEKNRQDKRISLVTISGLLGLYTKRKAADIGASTWGYTEEIGDTKVWVRWRNPKNPVHKVLAEIRRLAIKVVDKEERKARWILDKALNSDTFWWASGKPFWHPGMVRKGARLFYNAISLSKARKEDKLKAKKLVYFTLEEEMKRMRTRKQRKRILGNGK